MGCICMRIDSALHTWQREATEGEEGMLPIAPAKGQTFDSRT
jgi:hypothetical protein